MKRFLAAAFFSAIAFLPRAMAQCQPVRRAVVVGINKYAGHNRPPAFKVNKPLVPRLPVFGKSDRPPFWDLHGAVNDANEFAALLEGYQFEAPNVKVLLDENATAQNILDTVQRHLIDSSSCAGDVSVFFYSGHGSEIRNMFVQDENSPFKYDQTLVPYDAADGVPDIRSKELVRLYLAAARKGIYLTVIADSCQSGGLSRGAADFSSKGKYAPTDTRYVNDSGERDATGNQILPTLRSSGVPHPVLLLSAAYETEEAKETSSGDHGEFTAALLEKLRDHPEKEAIGTIFDDIKTTVSSRQSEQHPQITGEGRLDYDLFGQPADSTTGLLARVKRINPDGSFMLDKGTVAGLYENCELVSAMPGAADIRIKIRTARLADADAEVVGDNGASVQPSSRFRLDKWVVPEQNALSLYYEETGPSFESLTQAAAAMAQIGGQGIKIVTDPTIESATHQIWWLKGSWRLLTGNGATGGKDLGKTLDAARLHRLLGTGARLFINFPLPAKQASKLDLGKGSHNDAVKVQTQPHKPHYILAGKWTGENFEYAWLRPGVTEGDQPQMNLPIRSDWISAAAQDLEGELRAKALQLNRIYGWLTLAVPGGGTCSGPFPYHLALRKVGTSDFLKPGQDHTTGGEQYKIWLTADPAKVDEITKIGVIPQRWVYVLVLDCYGTVSKLIPSGDSNVGNYVPEKDTAPAEIQLTSQSWDFGVREPYGVDTYILLTSETNLDPRIFQENGVRTRSESHGVLDPLANLLGNIGANSRSRGEEPSVPSNWSVQTVTIRSVAKSN